MHLIREKDWKHFCDRLGEHLKGAQIALEHQQRGRGGQVETIRREGTLEDVQFTTTDACTSGIVFRFSGAEALDHTVFEPLRIWVEEAEDGSSYNPVVVEGESGKTTVELHPVLRAEWLEGLAIA